MARKLRIQYPGAIYLVMNRGASKTEIACPCPTGPWRANNLPLKGVRGNSQEEIIASDRTRLIL
jgi:hypothetical protein